MRGARITVLADAVTAWIVQAVAVLCLSASMVVGAFGMEPVNSDMSQADHYYRITVAFDGSDLSINGIARVDGPLSRRPALTGTMVYELLLECERIASGAFPDPRSSRHLERPEVGHGEPVAQVSGAFEFLARVPGGLLSGSDLGRLEIVIYTLEKPNFFETEVSVLDRLPLATAVEMAGVELPTVVKSQTGKFLDGPQSISLRDATQILGP